MGRDLWEEVSEHVGEFWEWGLRGEASERAVPGASAIAGAGRAGHWCCSAGHAGAAASANG